MQSAHIIKSVHVARTPRVMQCEGLFDVPPTQKSEQEWNVKLDLPEKWNVGVIVGPSGAGKSIVARSLFGKHLAASWDWPHNKSVLDGFPAAMGMKEIVEMLSSVGFSSPPSWLKPFRVLSNGEQFRVNMARTIAEKRDLAVVDEFTSVVDRNVARIGSAAIAKTVRRRHQQFIAVTCHYDVLNWLEPDWVYEPHTNEFRAERSLWRRPKIRLKIQRVHSSAWELFRKHHYLNTQIHRAAICFVAFWNDVPVAFASVLHFPHPKFPNTKREHRTVCLPDFQGVGIGNALSDFIGSMCQGRGARYLSITTHPAMIRARLKSPNWRLTAKPNMKTKTIPSANIEDIASGGSNGIASGGSNGIALRLRATFLYTGPPLDPARSEKLYAGA